MKFNISWDSGERRGGGEENECPCEMTRIIHAHRPSSNHKPLHHTARGREAHGRDASPGRALLAEREERGRGKCTRERHFNTFSRAWSVPGRFTPRGKICKEKTTAHRLALRVAAPRSARASRSKTVQNRGCCKCGSHMFTHGLGVLGCSRKTLSFLEVLGYLFLALGGQWQQPWVASGKVWMQGGSGSNCGVRPGRCGCSGAVAATVGCNREGVMGRGFLWACAGGDGLGCSTRKLWSECHGHDEQSVQ
eukprot:361974-Chlamydomonas_euryale.AAC.4